MSFNFDQENYRKLKGLILSSRRSNIVPFVGAGLSLYGPPEKRLPNWLELVDRILKLAKVDRLTADQAAEIKSLMEGGLHIEALNKLYTDASVEWVSQIVEQILEIEADGISPAAISLMAISWTLVVTTNLDRMLELAHEELELKGHRPKNSLKVFTSRNEDAFLRSMSIESAARTSLAKIHGTVEDYQSFVLTTTAYNQLHENGVYRFILQDLFRRTLLIIGFSLQDPDFDWAMDHVASKFRERNSPPYAILPDSIFNRTSDDPYRRRIAHLEQFNGLRVITYRIDSSHSADDVWSGHKELFECIKDLSSAWFENYKKLRIRGNILPEEERFVGRELELLKIDEMVLETNEPCQIQGFGGEGKTALISHWLKSRDNALSKNGIKDAFVFNCYVDSPAEFFASASQTLGGLPAGVSRAEQRASILSFAKTQKTLFVFDRFEIFQAPERNGQIRDKFLLSFLEELITLGSPIILTTRVTVPSLDNPIFLKPLKELEVDELVDLFLPSTPHPVTLRTALEHLQGHPQSIKLFLSNQESNGKALSAPFIPTQDRGEPLTDNKATYTLEQVQAGLSITEDIILQVACIFRYPFTLDTIRKILDEDIEMLNGWRNGSQDDSFLAKCVSSLVDKHLIISNDGPVTYLLHPNVRDYYTSIGRDHGEIHAAYVEILREQVAEEPIRSVSQANQYFSLAYHSAKAKNWSSYDDYYQRVLMRGQEDYVCDTLGMWSETLDLTRCVFPNGLPNTHAKIQSAYYSSRYARSLKHLGYGSEAADSYDSCLCFCAEERFSKSTIYVNNYLTLEVYRGNLRKAANMASWNFATMQWIGDKSGVCNQVEHGGYSIGWLTMLMGDFATAQTLFDLAAQAWKGREQEKKIFFDYYPVYFAELYLIVDGNEMRSQGILSSYLKLAQDHGWKETEARCHIFQSMLQRHTARKFENMEAFLQAAVSFCNFAEKVINKIFAPPVEIELIHELLCVHFEDPLSPHFKQESSQLMKRFMDLRSNLGWGIYQSDEIAFKGLESALRGKTERARALLIEAEAVALEQENRLALLSPYRPISMLRERLGLSINLSFSELANSKSEIAITRFENISSEEFTSAVENSFSTQPKPLE